MTFIPPITASHIAADKPLITLGGSIQLSQGMRSLPINTVWRWREEFLGVISGLFCEHQGEDAVENDDRMEQPRMTDNISSREMSIHRDAKCYMSSTLVQILKESHKLCWMT